MQKRNIRSILAVLALALALGVASAQPISPEIDIPGMLLKVKLNALFNPGRTKALVTLDMRVAKRMGVELGVGQALYDSEVNAKEERFTGPMLHVGYKYYLRRFFDRYSYIALEGRLEFFNNRSYETILLQGGAFTQIKLLHQDIDRQAILYKFGKMHYIGGTGRWILDGYIGLGAQWQNIEWRLPEGAVLVRDESFLFDFSPLPGKNILFLPAFGLHLSYLLK